MPNAECRTLRCAGCVGLCQDPARDVAAPPRGTPFGARPPYHAKVALKSQNADTGRRRLPALARWPLGRVAFGTFLLTLVLALGALGGVLSGLGLLSRSAFRAQSGTVLDVVKLVLAVVAGGGALVGLVIAYRRQLVAETADVRERTRLFNERFNAAAEQLGSDRAGIRQAGVYSMEGLADDWPEGRQKCIDVLCALARRGHVLQPPPDAPIEEQLAWDDDRQFRHAIMRVVADHLRPKTAVPWGGGLRTEAAVPWSGGTVDFTGAVIDGGDFEGIELSEGRLVFAGARFVGAAPLVLRGSRLVGGLLDVRAAVFESGVFDLSKAEIGPEATVNFSDSVFQDGCLDLRSTTIEGWCYLCRSQLAGTEFMFGEAELRGHGHMDFREARLAGGKLGFQAAVVAEPKQFLFKGARFEGATFDFSDARVEGEFEFGTAVPSGVILPTVPQVPVSPQPSPQP